MKPPPRFIFSEHSWFWAVSLTLLMLGLALRCLIFSYGLLEADEQIYQALVDQVAHGRGYTLRGHPILEQTALSRAMYDSPIFFHPPVGIWFFWLVQGLAGLEIGGLKVAQLVCYVIFALSSLGAMRLIFPRPSPALMAGFPLLVAFTPIYAHTNMKVWIDNPRLAFLMLHFFCCLLLLRRKDSGIFGLAALTSVLSPLTKVDALIAMPFLYGAVWALEADLRSRRNLLLFFTVLFAANGLAASWWLWWSEAIKYGPGRPSEELIATNEFIRFATKVMTTRQFLTDYAKLVTTFVPSLVVVLSCAIQSGRLSWKNVFSRLGPRAFLAACVLTHLVVFFFLAERGYSKLLRYLLMTTPASLFLFAYAVEDLRANPRRGWGTVTLATVLFLAYQAEVLHGVRTMVFGTNDPMVYPAF